MAYLASSLPRSPLRTSGEAAMPAIWSTHPRRVQPRRRHHGTVRRKRGRRGGSRIQPPASCPERGDEGVGGGVTSADGRTPSLSFPGAKRARGPGRRVRAAGTGSGPRRALTGHSRTEDPGRVLGSYTDAEVRHTLLTGLPSSGLGNAPGPSPQSPQPRRTQPAQTDDAALQMIGGPAPAGAGRRKPPHPVLGRHWPSIGANTRRSAFWVT